MCLPPLSLRRIRYLREEVRLCILEILKIEFAVDVIHFLVVVKLVLFQVVQFGQ